MLTTASSAPLVTDGLHRVLGQAFAASMLESGDLLTVKDLKSGRWIHVNPPMALFLRSTLADLHGCLDSDHLDAGLVTALRAAEKTAQSHSEPLRSEHAFELHGQRHEYSVLRMVIRDPAESRALMISVWHDLAPERKRQLQLQGALAQIEQQQQANDLLRREIADQALRDPASGLYRRAHFDDQLRREVDLSTREHREFAIVFIELDPHSSQARAQGALGQQRVLQSMGQLLRGGTRAMDASCRYDDRRFAVCFERVDDVLDKEQIDRHRLFLFRRNIWDTGKESSVILLFVQFIANIAEIEFERRV